MVSIDQVLSRAVACAFPRGVNATKLFGRRRNAVVSGTTAMCRAISSISLISTLKLTTILREEPLRTRTAIFSHFALVLSAEPARMHSSYSLVAQRSHAALVPLSGARRHTCCGAALLRGRSVLPQVSPLQHSSYEQHKQQRPPSVVRLSPFDQAWGTQIDGQVRACCSGGQWASWCRRWCWYLHLCNNTY